MKQKFKTLRLLERTERKYNKVLKEYKLLSEADDEDEGGEDDAAEDDGGDEGDDEGGDDMDMDMDMGGMGDDDMDGDMGADMSGDEEAQQEDPNDPSIQAQVEKGSYVSDTKMAEFAKTLIDAYMAQPPQQGEIPPDLLNVTTKNYTAVITYVTSLISLNKTTSTDGSNSEVEQELREVNS